MTIILIFATVSLLVATSSCTWIPPSQQNRQLITSSASFVSTSISSPSTEQETQSTPRLTTVLLKIGYDGAHFSGWCAGNPLDTDDAPRTSAEEPSSNNDSSSLPFRPSRRLRRRQARNHKRGHVRSVQGVFQKLLAKLYGDVDASRVVVEGCSRTDKGVHAQSMIAQVYCLSSTSLAAANSTIPTDPNISNIPGKKLAHPTSSWDDSSCFEPIPMDLSKLMYVLNRMLPHDVKVLGVAPVPVLSSSGEGVFHPSLNTESKTYQYTFSLGEIHDPTQWRTTWHLEYETSFSIAKARSVCQYLFLGTHDFTAFRGAPRGSDDKRRQETESTICTLSQVDIQETVDNTTFPGMSLSTYTVTVMGDRFLYKMMRFLVGAVVAVGTDKLTFHDIELALETGSWKGTDGRIKHFTCAPPHGLILKDVEYNVPLEWITCGNRISTC